MKKRVKAFPIQREIQKGTCVIELGSFNLQKSKGFNNAGDTTNKTQSYQKQHQYNKTVNAKVYQNTKIYKQRHITDKK